MQTLISFIPKRGKKFPETRSPGFSKESWNHKPGTVQKLEPNNTENLFPLSNGKCLSMWNRAAYHCLPLLWRDESIFWEGEILFWSLNVASATTWQFCTNRCYSRGSVSHVKWIFLNRHAMGIADSIQEAKLGFFTCLHLSTIGHLSPLPFIGTAHSEENTNWCRIWALN